MRKNLAHYLAATVLTTGPLAAGTLLAQEADLFSKLDANKDGYVTPDEVQEGQKALYERLLRTSDKDGDKKLSKEEFLAGLKPDEGPRPPLAGGQPFPGRGGEGRPDPREIFNRMDRNNDGKLSPDELPGPNEEARKNNFARMDTNNDGSISPQEFADAGRMFGQRPPGAPGAPQAASGTPQAAPDARRAEEMFAQADSNKDGKLTRDEVPDGRREEFDRMLQRMNPGGDSLTKEQFARGIMFTAQAGAPQPGQPPAGQPRPSGPQSREEFEALFDRTDANSDGKLTKDEIPEQRVGMRGILERSGGDSLTKEQFVRGMQAMAQLGGPQGRPEGAPQRRPDGAPGMPGGPPGGGLFAALDTDRNGELSTAEIVAAGTALLKLDRNGDGKLTPDETFGPGGLPGGFPGRPGEGRPGDGRPGDRPGGEARPGDRPPVEARPADRPPGERRPGDLPPGQRRPGVGQPGTGLPGAPDGKGRPGQRGLGGLSPEEFRERIKAADANNDGKISKDEAPPLIKDRFDRIDTNSDGFVDDNELREMVRRTAEGFGKAKGRPNNDNK